MVNRGPFDYRKLRGRIREKCGTQSKFANAIELSEVSVSNKLNNNVEWGQEEMESVIEVLDIPFSEIHSYFLLTKLRKLNKAEVREND